MPQTSLDIFRRDQWLKKVDAVDKHTGVPLEAGESVVYRVEDGRSSGQGGENERGEDQPLRHIPGMSKIGNPGLPWPYTAKGHNDTQGMNEE